MDRKQFPLRCHDHSISLTMNPIFCFLFGMFRATVESQCSCLDFTIEDLLHKGSLDLTFLVVEFILVESFRCHLVINTIMLS